jgi:hypothetical protein
MTMNAAQVLFTEAVGRSVESTDWAGDLQFIVDDPIAFACQGRFHGPDNKVFYGNPVFGCPDLHPVVEIVGEVAEIKLHVEPCQSKSE